MTYQQTFNDRQNALLSPIISEIEKGKSEITVDTNHPRELTELRSLIYAYLSPLHSNLKPLFRLRTISPTRLLLTRQATAAPRVSSADDSAECFFAENLLDIDNEDQAISVVRKCESDPAKQIAIIDYWRSRQ